MRVKMHKKGSEDFIVVDDSQVEYLKSKGLQIFEKPKKKKESKEVKQETE